MGGAAGDVHGDHGVGGGLAYGDLRRGGRVVGHWGGLGGGSLGAVGDGAGHGDSVAGHAAVQVGVLDGLAGVLALDSLAGGGSLDGVKGSSRSLLRVLNSNSSLGGHGRVGAGHGHSAGDLVGLAGLLVGSVGVRGRVGHFVVGD